MIDDIEKYSVGALLYTPALNTGISESIIKGKFRTPYSLAFCLEDTISEKSIDEAEQQLGITLERINAEIKSIPYLPKIFIRVRNSVQMIRLYNEYSLDRNLITGFIFPKYTVSNADEYNNAIRSINSHSEKKVYMMPILESSDIVEYSTRHVVLADIKTKIDSVKEFVLNIRVGGNDFSNEFSTRRHYDETIYEVLPISQLLGDILTVFSRDYVVSGPVWEFFSSDNEEWKQGLRKELKLDKLNGFVGKTVIHPKQISVVNDALKVSLKDYEDAKRILNWDGENSLLVGKSFAGERMNEIKPHMNWAYKTIALSKIFGVI